MTPTVKVEKRRGGVWKEGLGGLTFAVLLEGRSQEQPCSRFLREWKASSGGKVCSVIYSRQTLS